MVRCAAVGENSYSVSYNRLAVSIPRRVAIDVLEAVCLVTPGQIASSSDWLVSFRILVDTFAIAGLPDSRSPLSSFPDEPVVVRRIDVELPLATAIEQR